jgi:hypothetical protein
MIGAAINAATGKLTSRRRSSTARGQRSEFLWDTDADGVDERYRFERLPIDLEVAGAGGKRLRILGLHLKSKAIFDAYEWSKWWAVSGGNRRKILAQALFIRDQFVVPYLKDPATAGVPLVVCGDINDGPGPTRPRKLLFSSGIEMLMGDSWTPDVALGSALYDSLSETAKRNMDFETLATSRFRTSLQRRLPPGVDRPCPLLPQPGPPVGVRGARRANHARRPASPRKYPGAPTTRRSS